MNQDIKIFVLTNLPSLGEMGTDTIVEEKELCKFCGNSEEIFKKFVYNFSTWNGEDLIEVAGIYFFVSERLKNKLEPLVTKEIEFKPIENKKSDYFKSGSKIYQKDIPTFFKLNILKSIDGPEVWWKRTDLCAHCNNQKWNFTLEGIRSTISTSKEYIQREVYRDKWNGELIFNLNDPGLPIVTQKFMEIVNSLGGHVKYDLKEAKWV